jgi:hypothetical protein
MWQVNGYQYDGNFQNNFGQIDIPPSPFAGPSGAGREYFHSYPVQHNRGRSAEEKVNIDFHGRAGVTNEGELLQPQFANTLVHVSAVEPYFPNAMGQASGICYSSRY